MCGRYSITTPPDALRELFDFDDLPNLAPRYNLAPTQVAPVVRMKNGRRRLDSLTWGLVPAWSRDSGCGGAPL
ncbi:MAG: SOS response-associated peptidase family protein, partial [Pseudomonadota bacterium]|nr:SOS response-associated peptidase family protein [Pseudomonadota bacterium]